jgi:4-aminobutyrate aminotransferase-like enzyme
LVVVDRVGVDTAIDEIGPESVGLMDDILGEGGVLVPSANYWNEVVTSGDFVVL